MNNMLFDSSKIEEFVLPSIEECNVHLINVQIKITININLPEEFKFNYKIKEVYTNIEEIRISLTKTYKGLTEIIGKFEEAEIKNNNLINEILDMFKISAAYSSTNNDSRVKAILGRFEAVDKTYMGGQYTGNNRRIYRVCNQMYVTEDGTGMFFGVDYTNKCNRGAEATIISGYTEEDIDVIIQKLNTEHKDGRVIASNEFWGQYGLQVTEENGRMNVGEIGMEGSYTDKLWNHLQETGGCAMIWVTSYDVYNGKSGRVWTRDWNLEDDEYGMHWVAVIDYRVKDGKEQIAIANPGSGQVEWYDIDEFKEGVTRMVLINEIIY